MAGRQSALESLVVSGFWRDRPTFVTGATGLVGGWLVRRLLDEGADVVCLVRDWVPGSEFVQAGLIERVNVVRGDLCNFRLMERVLAEYEVDTVHPSGRPDDCADREPLTDVHV